MLYAKPKSTSGDYQAFGIDLIVPSEACIVLSTHDWTNAGLYAATFNASLTKKVPVDLSTATELCDAE